ncbi:hypothetical protein Tco_1401502 [Tanacetum coccineum]
MTKLTQKGQVWSGGGQTRSSVPVIKAKSCVVHQFAYPKEVKILSYTAEASKKGLGGWVNAKGKGKANVVADALSRKEREPPLRVRALVMTIGLDLPKQILNAQTEARKLENIKNEDVGGVGYLVIIDDFTDCDHARVYKSKYSSIHVPRKCTKTSRLNIRDNRVCWYNPRYLNGSGTISRMDKGIPFSIICDRDPRFASISGGHFSRLLGTSFSMEYGYSSQLTDNAIENQFKLSKICFMLALYGLEMSFVVCWAEVGEVQLTGPEIVQETTEKIIQVKQRMQAARDRQKSYADLKRKPMEFEVGDKVMLKVSSWERGCSLCKRGIKSQFVEEGKPDRRSQIVKLNG